MRIFTSIIGITICLIFLPVLLKADNFYVKNYGAAGDGIKDDGPTIQKAFNAMKSHSGKHTLVFESGRQYYIRDIEGIYLFKLIDQSNLTIDGNGAVFLLDGAKRLISAQNSGNLVLKNLSIDYKQLPFVEGKIIAINQTDGYVDVQIDGYFEMPPPGGPTNLSHEQAYFGQVWYDGPNSLLSSHYYVKDMHEIYPGSSRDRKLRVDATNFREWNKIAVNQTISLPVRGNAHIGGNEVVHLVECRNIVLENVNIWSAPWFAVGLTRNLGEVKFSHVNVTPKPGTKRILSSWRDGIHVKSNYARLVFDSCHLEGMGDDAFNIATFMSSVKKVISGNQIQIKQNFPLSIVPYNTGDVVVVYDIVQGIILGKSSITSSSGFVQTGATPAPLLTLRLKDAIRDMNLHCVVWNESSANPNTLLKNCSIYKSCRFQSSVTIDNCNIIAFSWFWTTNIEGPIPGDVVVRNSRLFVGRGNDKMAASFNTSLSDGGKVYPSVGQPISNVLLQNNEIRGNLMIKYCKKVSVVDNNFSGKNSEIQIGNCGKLLFSDNMLNGSKLERRDQIIFMDEESKRGTTVK